MKRFVGVVISYLMVLVIISVAVNAIYIRMNKADTDYTDKFSEMPSNIQVCNTGSSHGLYGFNYENYENAVCFNFGLVSQTLSYDYRLLDNYRENISEGCVVFIPISYGSLFGKNEIEAEDFKSKNRRYYKILPPNLIKEFDWADYFYSKIPAFTAGGDNLVWIFAGKELESGEAHSEWNQTADEIDLIADVETSHERHLGKDKTDEFGRYIVIQEELGAIYDIIGFCNENGWKPVLITTPFLDEYSNLAFEESSDALVTFYTLVDNVVKDTGVEYYDYSLDERFSSRHDLFMNGDHLNREGARQFTDILFEEILNTEHEY